MNLIESVSYRPEHGERGLGDIYLSDDAGPATPVALAIHGGAWVGMEKSSWAGVAAFLCEQGFAVYNVHYRYATEAPWPAIGDDCLAAARFVLDAGHPAFAGLDRRRLLIIGGSAGGHLALTTGLRLPPDRVFGIVSISGLANLQADFPVIPDLVGCLWGRRAPTPAELADASPYTMLTADHPPILCTHCLIDFAEPYVNVAAFVDRAHAVGGRARLYGYQRNEGGHSIWIPDSDPHRLHPDLARAIATFIAEVDESRSGGTF